MRPPQTVTHPACRCSRSPAPRWRTRRFQPERRVPLAGARLPSGPSSGRRVVESHRFDTIAKTLGSGTSRRRVLRGLLSGAAAAGILARFSVPAAAGTCKAEGRACKKTSQCCGGLDCLQSGNGPKNPQPNTGSTAGSGRVCTNFCAGHDFTSGGEFKECGRGQFGACFCDLTTKGRAAAGRTATAGTSGSATHRTTVPTVRSASTPRTAGRTACYPARPQQLGLP
jgi:hypothetical protein